jgi:hypothetical protein
MRSASRNLAYETVLSLTYKECSRLSTCIALPYGHLLGVTLSQHYLLDLKTSLDMF